MLVKDYFKDREIFITGGSGFIGKALIEKLLRSCPDVKRIYLLIRAKKGKTADERLCELFKSSLFDRVRQEQPKSFRKVIAITGDCSEIGLGISSDDLLKLNNVTTIYHAAASVRFDDSLRHAILLNTRGTYELIKIAERLEQLQVFIHVSTTYCNPDKHIVEEKVYPAYADWRTTIKLAETYDTELLNIFNAKYGNHQPNTYTFTKSLAEQICNDYRNKLPLILFRPSIVVSSIVEPIAGWVDNFNGPIGLLVACGTGIMRTNYADPDTIADFVPVDIVARSLLLTAFQKGLEDITPNLNRKDNDELHVINCAANEISPITLGQIIDIGKTYIRENPFEKTLWVPGGYITRCRVWNFIKFMTLHILMAVVLDTTLRIAGQKPFLLKLQRRIYAAQFALHFFLTTMWDFKNEEFRKLDKLVESEETDEFGFMQFSAVDYVDFFRNGIRGAKEFLLKESPNSSKNARLRMTIFQILHFLIQAGSVYFILRYLYRIYF